jgi:polyferredoxin
MFILLLAGAGGGLVRGIVGFLKYQFAYKNVEFRPWYIVTTMVLSAFVGLTVTWAVVQSGLQIAVLEQVNPAIALIIGYAGGDLIENLYKILVGKATLYPLPKK